MSPRFRVLPIVAIASLVSACSEEESLLSPKPDTANTQLAVSSNFPGGMASVGDLLLVLVNEAEQDQTDLNGDDDVADNVVHLVNTATDEVVNLGMVGSQNMASDDRYIVWSFAEEDAGEDLNGDGFVSDNLIAIFDTAINPGPNNPRVVPVAADPTAPILADDGFFVFRGLNTAVRVLNGQTKSVYSTGIRSLFYTVGSQTVAFTASEEAVGADLNGDTDIDDIGLGFHRFGSGSNTIIPRAVDVSGIAVVGTDAEPVILYAVDEAGEGDDSLNAEGLARDLDNEDFIAACFDVATATEFLPGNGLAVQPARTRGSSTRATFSALELDNWTVVPADFNGDGDDEDVVPFWVDLDDLGTLNHVGLAQDAAEDSVFPQVCGQYMFVLVDEASEANTNFNSRLIDTDTDDTILAFVDMRTPGATLVTNMEVAATQLVCPDTEDPSWVIAITPESDNGSFDMNQDGDAGDEVVSYFPISDSGQISTLLRVSRGGGTSNSIAIECADTITLFSFANEGTGVHFGDVNVDQDTTDVVATVQIISKDTHAFGLERYLGTVRTIEDGETSSSADFPFALHGGTLVFPTTEGSVGTGRDYNGDGDTSDSVLFTVDVTCGE